MNGTPSIQERNNRSEDTRMNVLCFIVLNKIIVQKSSILHNWKKNLDAKRVYMSSH